jgi:hypothetical protein
MPHSLPVLDGFALFPFKIIQTAGEIVILHEHDNLFRQIFLDGGHHLRKPQPSKTSFLASATACPTTRHSRREAAAEATLCESALLVMFFYYRRIYVLVWKQPDTKE